MQLSTSPYFQQVQRWPAGGRHILAQFDEESVVVYQAYRPAIARYALEHGLFGGDFSYSRMSWIKPNFLWMMYRSGWGTKEGQESILALRLRRDFFDRLLSASIPSSWDDDLFDTEDAWSRAVEASTIRIQWDPDHDPFGGKLDRKAIQLGLRGDALEEFGKHQLLEVIDMTDFVADQRMTLNNGGVNSLKTPTEDVYRPFDTAIVKRLKLADADQ